MRRVRVDGAELEYDDQGSGEPVVLIHGSIIADAFAPLLKEPSLTEHYRVISYHRRGFAGSTHHSGPFTIRQQAADSSGVMKHLNLDRAHIVGHSYGGLVALQLALDAPPRVHSLSLLEPALIGAIPSGPQAMQLMMQGIGLYQAGNKAGAIDAFSRLVGGENYRSVVDRVVPGAFELAVRDADTFFEVEVPAMQSWIFTSEDAKRIKQPVLNVLGAESDQFMQEVHKLVREWLPQAETLSLTKANHMLQIMNPKGMADGLTAFFAKHPLEITVPE